MSRPGIESSDRLDLDFDKLHHVGEHDVIPVVVQNVDTLAVLILAYVNAEALALSVGTRKATFYSTSRKSMWVKGAESGDFLDIVEIRVNCEQNSLLFLVRPRTGSACHATNAAGDRYSTCFYRRVDANRLTVCE